MPSLIAHAVKIALDKSALNEVIFYCAINVRAFHKFQFYMQAATSDITRGSVVNSSATRTTATTAKTDKEKKIGHRRVGEDGGITYKKIQTSTIMGSIQLGIQHTVSGDLPPIYRFMSHKKCTWTFEMDVYGADR
jgi:hypothetical protein